MTFRVLESRLLALMLLSLLEALRDGYCSMRRAAGFPYYPFYAIVVHIVGASSDVRPSSPESNNPRHFSNHAGPLHSLIPPRSRSCHSDTSHSTAISAPVPYSRVSSPLPHYFPRLVAGPELMFPAPGESQIHGRSPEE